MSKIKFGFDPIPENAYMSLNEIAVPVSPPANAKETATYRAVFGEKELLVDFDQIKTVQDVFNNSAKQVPNLPFMGWQTPILGANGLVTFSEYKWKTYGECNQARINFGAGLMHLYESVVKNLQDQWFLGIFSINRYEWIISEYGAGAYAIPTVALYSTLGESSSAYIINHAEVPIVAASMENVPTLLQIAPSCPTLKAIIVFEPLFQSYTDLMGVLTNWGLFIGVQVISFSKILELGANNPRTMVKVSADDLICLQYTSGTTGNPKGAMITHRNVVSNLRTAAQGASVNPDDVYISYLPLAHILERTMLTNVILFGAKVGFYSGDFQRLVLNDIPKLKPTLFMTVPRILQRIYDKVMVQANANPVRAALFQKAVNDKLYYLNKDKMFDHTIWDTLVFRKVRAALGGRIRLMGCGSAAIAPEVLQFFRVALGCNVLEGYGLTESTGAVTAARPYDFSTKNVGAVVFNAELKLVSVPEMNYHAKDLKGEVWVRGPCVFKGYYKQPDKTKETITDDGWLLTGDIGALDAAGRLSIIDRKKNIFKLSQGEYVAPEKLENIFGMSPFLMQIYVHGNPLESQLVAIGIPDQEHSVAYAVANGLLPKETPIPESALPGQPLVPVMQNLVKIPAFQRVVFEDLKRLGNLAKLQGFEMIKALHLDTDPMSTGNDLLTPTFKMKRPFVAKKYRNEINKMYAELAKTSNMDKGKL